MGGYGSVNHHDDVDSSIRGPGTRRPISPVANFQMAGFRVRLVRLCPLPTNTNNGFVDCFGDPSGGLIFFCCGAQLPALVELVRPSQRWWVVRPSNGREEKKRKKEKGQMMETGGSCCFPPRYFEYNILRVRSTLSNNTPSNPSQPGELG